MNHKGFSRKKRKKKEMFEGRTEATANLRSRKKKISQGGEERKVKMAHITKRRKADR